MYVILTPAVVAHEKVIRMYQKTEIQQRFTKQSIRQLDSCHGDQRQAP